MSPHEGMLLDIQSVNLACWNLKAKTESNYWSEVILADVDRFFMLCVVSHRILIEGDVIYWTSLEVSCRITFLQVYLGDNRSTFVSMLQHTWLLLEWSVARWSQGIKTEILGPPINEICVKLSFLSLQTVFKRNLFGKPTFWYVSMCGLDMHSREAQILTSIYVNWQGFTKACW